MAPSIAVQVSRAVAVLALLRSRSALGSPHGNLPPRVDATDDAGLPNATTADIDVRTDHARHSSYNDELLQWFYQGRIIQRSSSETINKARRQRCTLAERSDQAYRGFHII